MDMIDTEPESLTRTPDPERTLYTLDNIPTGTLWPVIGKETSQLSNTGFDHENLVVIPTYNKAERLAELVRHLLQQWPLDILIVDERSPDGTGEIAEQLALLFPGRVDILHQRGRLGSGSAFTAALRYALKRGYSMLFSLESDFSERPFPAPILRCVLNENGVVLSVDTGKEWSM